jgi:hypothetical protein
VLESVHKWVIDSRVFHSRLGLDVLALALSALDRPCVTIRTCAHLAK